MPCRLPDDPRHHLLRRHPPRRRGALSQSGPTPQPQTETPSPAFPTMSHKTTYQICKEHPAFQTIRTMAESIKHPTKGVVFSNNNPSYNPNEIKFMNAHENTDQESVALHHLVRQLQNINSELLEEMRRQYPVGSRVVFWRSANQRRESFGTVVSHTTAHGPEIRVRYDGSNHIVGLHVGYTKFHSLPNATSEGSPTKDSTKANK